MYLRTDHRTTPRLIMSVHNKLAHMAPIVKTPFTCRADPAPATMLIHKIKQIKQTVRTHLLNAAHDSDGSTVKWRNRARFAEFLL